MTNIIEDIAAALETKDENGKTLREIFIQMEKNNEIIMESYKDLVNIK